MFKSKPSQLSIALFFALLANDASAALWSDTNIGYRYGTKFREPVIGDDVSKDIFHLSHASGYKYGTNFFNADVLLSDDKDPISPGSSKGAQEIYMVYRHTLSLGAITGKDFAFGGIIRDFGFTLGFDVNSKNDAGYNSAKRMLVAGPAVMLDVPGFATLSFVQLWESNAPYNKFSSTQTPRYHYDPHPALFAAWGIPFNVGSVALSFEGYCNWISAKGKDEFGNQTAPEINFDGRVMYDLSPIMNIDSNTFKIGFEYQYWRNKFGNNNHNDFFEGGALARTPMIRAEYHF